MSISKFKAAGVALMVGASGAGQAADPVNLTMYGTIDTGFVATNHTGNGRQNTEGFADSILGVSNLGFKGNRDLGGGIEGFFNLQAGFNPSTGRQNQSDVLFSRNAYVGLQGALGAVSVGKQWDLNDDWLVGSVFLGGYNSGAIFKFSEFDAVSDLYNNTIKYVTPTVSGMQGGAMLSFQGRAGDNKAGRIYNLGGKYTGGPLYAGITYYHEDDGDKNTPSTGSSYHLTTAGAKYSLENVAFRLGLAFADITGPGAFQSIPSMSARKAQAGEIGVDYSFSEKIKGSADVLYRRNSTLDNHSTGLRLLGVYTLTPQASLLANVAYLKNGGGAAETLVNTDSGAIGGGFANQNQTSIALGGRYSF